MWFEGEGEPEGWNLFCIPRYDPIIRKGQKKVSLLLHIEHKSRGGEPEGEGKGEGKGGGKGEVEGAG